MSLLICDYWWVLTSEALKQTNGLAWVINTDFLATLVYAHEAYVVFK